MNLQRHRDQNQVILNEFTNQAALPENRIPALTNLSAIELLIETSGVTDEESVLDVACGAGYVACAFGTRARQVAGIDITPAMIERARQLQTARELTNVSWLRGDVLPLPFRRGSFSMVMTRYSFHHFVDPLAVLRQMALVCRPGGRVVVTDAAPAAEKQEAYNRMEKLRDPSHVRALTSSELLGLHASAGLRVLRTVPYRLDMELESLLSASFPNTGDAERIRQSFEESLVTDGLDLGTHRRGNEVYFGYPSLIIVSEHAD